ncbi:hypothetical protein F4604DRAFT_1595791 [Suillus subluteus]|nr:hypothetical protein F4604DRAFT_1595791 [Suillus subluteus]
MLTMKASTGYAPFHLHLGRMPHLLPPLMPENIYMTMTQEDFPSDIVNMLKAIVSLKTNVADAHNTLLASCITQAHLANVHRSEDPSFKVGDFAYLSTAHR